MIGFTHYIAAAAPYLAAFATIVGGGWVWVLQQRYARRVMRAEDCTAAIWELSGEVGKFSDPVFKNADAKKRGELTEKMWSAYRVFNKTFQPIRLMHDYPNLGKDVELCLRDIQEEGVGSGGQDHPKLAKLIGEIEVILKRELEPHTFLGP
jgi:hypothetical protein